jgi:hypothetical protein
LRHQEYAQQYQPALAHCTEKVAYMKSARRLYARKNPQIKLLIPKSQKPKTKNVRLFRLKIAVFTANVKDLDLSMFAK